MMLLDAWFSWLTDHLRKITDYRLGEHLLADNGQGIFSCHPLACCHDFSCFWPFCKKHVFHIFTEKKSKWHVPCHALSIRNTWFCEFFLDIKSESQNPFQLDMDCVFHGVWGRDLGGYWLILDLHLNHFID